MRHSHPFAVALISTFFAAAVATLGVTPDAQAARSSKPREIVVVGSKVKEVIRSAGFRSDGQLVQAVSDKVHEILGAAARRAAANHRRNLMSHDIPCLSDSEHPELLVKPGKNRRILRATRLPRG